MRTVEPRPAATVVVARDAPPGVEVLLVRRSSSGFAPGFLVFPGGVVDAADRDLAARWFGDPDEASRACALRELYEETGLLVTAHGMESHPERPPIGDLSFEPPPETALPEIGHWVAPAFLRVRFDARFFAAAAPPELRAHPDGVEVERAWWAPPARVVDASGQGEAWLMWPTLVTLDRLAACASVDDVLALRIEQIEPGGDDRIRGSWRRPEWGAAR
jgi:8-oxo-dGTP pyrophosphatase MutT (NUDIX family)